MAELIKYEDSLRQGTDKLNESIKASNRAEQKSDQAVNTSNEAKSQSQSAENKADTTQQQLDNIIIESGTSDAETIQARGKYDLLYQRFESNEAEYLHYRNELINKALYNKISNHRKPKPLITFTDDDGALALYNTLYPIAVDEDIPISAALVTGSVGDPDYITMPMFEEMKQSGRVEFMSHTVTHPRLGQIPLDEVERELRDSKKWLEDNGVDSDYLVYPYGSRNSDVIEIVKKYYKAAFNVENNPNTTPLKPYNVNRYDFEKTIEQHKQYIDIAKENNYWIVITIHSGASTFSESKLREIIAYAKQQEIEIVSAEEGMRHFGNLVDLGDKGGIDAHGNPYGVLSEYQPFPADVSPNVGIIHFKKGISTREYTTNQANSFNLPRSGVVTTVRTQADEFSFQVLRGYRSTSSFYRYWDGSQWSEWSGDINNRHNNLTTLTPDEPLSSFPLGESWNFFTSSQASYYNLPGSGNLQTIRMTADDFSIQILHRYRSSTTHRRYWNGSSWSEWSS